MSGMTSQLSFTHAKLEVDVEDEVLSYVTGLPKQVAAMTIVKAAAALPRTCCLQEDWTADDFDHRSVFHSTAEQREWLAKEAAKCSQDKLWHTISVGHVHSSLAKLPPDTAAYIAYEVAQWVVDKGQSTSPPTLPNTTAPKHGTHAPAELSEAVDPEESPAIGSFDGVSLEDFYAHMPTHQYIFMPTREPWPASSVNSRIKPVLLLDKDGKTNSGEQIRVTASVWLDRNKPVEQMAWAPGLPEVIRDRLIAEGGWIERTNVACLNLYRPATIELGNAAQADQWVDHLHKIYPNDAEHITKFLSHRVQYPEQKINHALLLGGNQGIGKDTLLEPAKHAVGPWNVAEVSPQSLVGRFNGYLKSVILRVSEARDLGEVNRYSFYEHMKVYAAAPPDVLRCDEKNLREHSVINVCGVIITTNHKTDGIYLPADDRRHYVAWSDLTKEDFVKDYWRNLWKWYATGGLRHVAAYLAEYDLSNFDPKAPPPKTAAFFEIVDANRAPEEAELSDVFDKMGTPGAATLEQIKNAATGDFEECLGDRKNRRSILHRR